MHKKAHKKKWLYLFLSVAVYAFIIANSLLVADTSRTISNDTSNIISEFLNFIGIKGVVLSQFIIRKGAHISEYFLLGISVSLTFKYLYNKVKFLICSAVPLCFVLASVDEFIQTFVPGRAGRIIDVFIDSIGFILAIGLVAIFTKRK